MPATGTRRVAVGLQLIKQGFSQGVLHAWRYPFISFDICLIVATYEKYPALLSASGVPSDLSCEILYPHLEENIQSPLIDRSDNMKAAFAVRILGQTLHTSSSRGDRDPHGSETQPRRFFTASHVPLRPPDAFSTFKKEVNPGVHRFDNQLCKADSKAPGNY